MFFIILFDGARIQKIKAAYYFFFFTIFGSLLLFLNLNYLYIQYNTLNLYKLYLYKDLLTLIEQKILWLTFFLSFAVKIPIFPFHLWLPEAHVEASTLGSVLLAGILLKLGCYGFVRFSLLLVPLANIYFSSFIYICCSLGIYYSGLIILRQTDIKRIIAYASISHMNLIIIGLYSFNIYGLYGAIFQSISHGLVSSGLFLLIGILYTRYKSRNLFYYSGLTQIMPMFSSIFFFFILANVSFPFTSNFIGEFLIFLGLGKINLFFLIFIILSIILNITYSLWFCNRLIFGNIKSQFILFFKDLIYLEKYYLFMLCSLIILLGCFPKMLLFNDFLIFYLKILLFINL